MRLNDIFPIPQLCVNKNIEKTVIDPSTPELPTPITPIKSAIKKNKSSSSICENGKKESDTSNIIKRSRSHSGSDIVFQFKTILPSKEISSLSIDTLPFVDLIGKEEKHPIDNIFEQPRTETLPKQSNPTHHEEHQYLDLIRDIINNGYLEKGRNGNTMVKFGHSMRFSLREGTIPILTTKRVAWKSCFEELFWFIRGSTSNHELIAKNVHIWDANGSREFLDSRGLYFLEENDLGPIYGFQWRHFNADYKNCNKNYDGEGIDQLSEIIENLKNPETRSSRRLIMTAWNPCQLNSMALPPCHVLAQFHVREGRYLSCALYQRSGDVGLGVPFNIASYSLLTHILAVHCGLEPDEFVYFLGNCHIYEQHIPALKTQIDKKPKEFPRIRIANKHENIEEYNLEDIIWETKYESLGTIKMEMVA